LNKQHFFVAFIFPIGLGGGFYAPARTNTSLRSLPITCRGKKTPQHTKSYHKKKCCGIKVNNKLWRLENGLWKEYPGVELTENERSMLRLTVGGLSIEKIADRLLRSAETIKSYRRFVFKKLEVGNITEAIMMAINKKLI